MEVEEASRVNKALKMYEKGASSEATGLMREAIRYYSSAIKIHHDVEKIYRDKVHEEYKRQQKEYEQQQLQQQRQKQQQDQLSSKLKVLRIGAKQSNPALDDREGGVQTEEIEEEEEVMEPCWLLDILTDDVLIEISTILSYTDQRSHVLFSASCRRISQLAFSSMVYKHICRQVYPYQVYSPSAIQMNNITSDQDSMVNSWDYQWGAMLNDRPFLKYRGVYISKVTYISQGARSFKLNNTIKIVTYFRYMRFYPDGVALKVTTTDPPSVVVPRFSRENVKEIKMALLARFSLEMDGHVTLVRRTKDLEFVEEFKIVSLGDRKFHRLQWISSGSINKDREISYNDLSKEKPFNFSGVRSFGSGR